MASTTTHRSTTAVKGAGLARGPALVLGVLLAAIGLALFLHAGNTPTGAFPDGDARGAKVLGLESNGWTAYFTTVAGVLLLFGAAQHLLAKAMSLIVGIGLLASALIALFHSPGVLGLAAANTPVEVGWGVAGIVLLLNVLAPRRTREEPVATAAVAVPHADEPVGPADRVDDRPRVDRTRPNAGASPAARDEAATRTTPAGPAGDVTDPRTDPGAGGSRRLDA